MALGIWRLFDNFTHNYLAEWESGKQIKVDWGESGSEEINTEKIKNLLKKFILRRRGRVGILLVIMK